MTTAHVSMAGLGPTPPGLYCKQPSPWQKWTQGKEENSGAGSWLPRKVGEAVPGYSGEEKREPYSEVTRTRQAEKKSSRGCFTSQKKAETGRRPWRPRLGSQDSKLRPCSIAPRLSHSWAGRAHTHSGPARMPAGSTQSPRRLRERLRDRARGPPAGRRGRPRLTRAHGRSRADPSSSALTGTGRPLPPRHPRAPVRSSTTTWCARRRRPAAPLLEVDCQKSVGLEPQGNSCRK